ncbi:hypothetical protein F5141DRAFT_1061307 [Pisolithus sp. B1]|nr:hypothetical protein F5141DRAFT_1061307 [Pisolithus sp. B1]
MSANGYQDECLPANISGREFLPTYNSDRSVCKWNTTAADRTNYWEHQRWLAAVGDDEVLDKSFLLDLIAFLHRSPLTVSLGIAPYPHLTFVNALDPIEKYVIILNITNSSWRVVDWRVPLRLKPTLEEEHSYMGAVELSDGLVPANPWDDCESLWFPLLSKWSVGLTLCVRRVRRGWGHDLVTMWFRNYNPSDPSTSDWRTMMKKPLLGCHGV